MAQPPAYYRKKDFTEDFGNETDHATLNAELDTASNSINDIRANLAILQADDGKLRPSVVTVDSISHGLRVSLVEGVVMDAQVMLDRSREAADASSAAAFHAETSRASAEAASGQSLINAQAAEGSAVLADRSASNASEYAARASNSANHIENVVNNIIDEVVNAAPIKKIGTPNGVVLPFYNVTISGRHPVFWGEDTADAGWVICDGGSDGRDGNVPDLRDKFIMGASDENDAGITGGTISAATSTKPTGGTVGNTTLTEAQMPAHTHTKSGFGQLAGIRHTDGADYIPLRGDVGYVAGLFYMNYAGSSATHTHSFTGEEHSHAVDVIPPYYKLVYCVKLPV